MPIILYTVKIASPPVRAVETIIKIINLDVEYRYMDVVNKEYLEPWYLKLNPVHQMPLLDDNGFILAESHAIIAYLLTSYAPKEILEQYYPTDPKLRAIVDSRWHFELGMIFGRGKAMFLPMYKDRAGVPLELTEFLIDAVDILEKILEDNEWLAGDKLTVADISMVTTFDVVQLLVPLEPYKNIRAWRERTHQTLPFYEEATVEDLAIFDSFLKDQSNYDAQKRWDQLSLANK